MGNKNHAACQLSMRTALIEIDSDWTVIIDQKNFTWLAQFRWRAVRKFKSYYALTSVFKNGRYRDVGMHRMVAKTPTGQVCHHRNRNTLDNREKNLLNMGKTEHNFLHKNNTLSIKFE